MQNDEFIAATERVNAGTEIPAVTSSLVEHMWEAMSSISQERRQHTAIGLEAIAGPDLVLLNPEQQVALTVRYFLLEGLIELGLLDENLKDESQQKRVFAAAASFPCNKDDLADATMRRVLRDSPPEAAQKAYEEFRQAGYDPERPEVGERFKRWMQDNY
jgi:hypothetical protein